VADIPALRRDQHDSPATELVGWSDDLPQRTPQGTLIMPERRRRLPHDTQAFAFFFLTLSFIVVTSLLVGGLFAIGSVTAGALCALVYERLRP
jgi:hypothetical protein